MPPQPCGAIDEDKAMKFASTRLVAADIKTMVRFYEMVTCRSAKWLAPVFAEIVTPAATPRLSGSAQA
jgi:hypothetical protein